MATFNFFCSSTNILFEEKLLVNWAFTILWRPIRYTASVREFGRRRISFQNKKVTFHFFYSRFKASLLVFLYFLPVCYINFVWVCRNVALNNFYGNGQILGQILWVLAWSFKFSLNFPCNFYYLQQTSSSGKITNYELSSFC